MMIYGYKRLKMVLNHDKRSGTVRDGQGRSGTVRGGQGRWTVRDDGLWVTLAKNGNGTVMGR